MIAGPGAGKTAVIRERIFNLVQRQGVAAEWILTLAFSKPAEQELLERTKDIGKVEAREPFIRRLMKEDSKTGRVDARKLRQIASKVDIVRANVREGLFAPSELKPEAKRFAIAYETFKAQQRLMDFDDMLITAALFMRGQKALHGWFEDGAAIVVDEIVERMPSDLMEFFGKRLQQQGVSTTKEGIHPIPHAQANSIAK